MAKKNITNAIATTIAAIAFADGMDTAMDALAKTGFTVEELTAKLSHMAKVANKNNGAGKSIENAQIAAKIVEWLAAEGEPKNSAQIMAVFGLNSSAKVSIVLRDACTDGTVIRGREDSGKVTYRVER